MGVYDVGKFIVHYRNGEPILAYTLRDDSGRFHNFDSPEELGSYINKKQNNRSIQLKDIDHNNFAPPISTLTELEKERVLRQIRHQP